PHQPVRKPDSPATKAEPHPLDPLDEKEITSAVEILKSEKKRGEGVLFPVLALHEPPKKDVLAWQPGQPIRRQANACVLDREANRAFEAIIDLGQKKTVSWKEVPGVQPNATLQEFDRLAPDLVRQDKRWQKAMRERGYKEDELRKMYLEGWAMS